MQCDCSAIPLLQFWIVILSEAKDLLFLPRCKRQQVLRFAQDDKFFNVTNHHLGYRNEYPLASFPDMNRVLYSSK